MATRAVCVFAFITLASSSSGSQLYEMSRSEHFEMIDANLSWSINMRTHSILFEVVAPIASSNGWLALGISDTGGMKGADIGLVSLRHGRIFDLHSTDFVMPAMDKVQNWKLLNLGIGAVDDSYSVVQFERHLLSCDEEDNSITNDRLRHNLMLAYHADDVLLSATTSSRLSLSRHTHQQRKEINLFFDEQLFLPQTKDDLFTDFVVDELNLSQSDVNTQYWCSLMNVTEPRYLTLFDILDTTGLSLVHHAEILLCQSTDDIVSEPRRCGAYNYRYEMECQLIVAMASGSEVRLPSEVHYLLEVGVYNLEIHFDLNPVAMLDLSAIAVSGSGLRAFYGLEPRAMSMGLLRLEMGEFSIPPERNEFSLSFAMHAECTRHFVPEHGIDILLMGGHMHYLGRSIRIDRISQHGVVDTLFKLNNFDFDRQFAYPVHHKLRRGDTLRAHCVFDSSGVVNWTHYGLTTSDEMCQVYIGYVSKIDGLNLVYSRAVEGDAKTLPPSYCGPSFIQHWDDISDAQLIFNNSMQLTSSNEDLVVHDDVDDVCRTLIFDNAGILSTELVWSYELPVLTVVVITAILIALKVTEVVMSHFRPGNYAAFADSADDRRKLTIYAFSPLFFSWLLVVLLWEIGWRSTEVLAGDECDLMVHEYSTPHSVSNPYVMGGAANTIVVFYILELAYRGSMAKWDLWLHHTFAILIIVLLSNAIQATFNVYLNKLGFCYLLQIATEQPIFIALLIRKLKLRIVDAANYPNMFYGAAAFHLLTKAATTAMVWYFYIAMLRVQDDDVCSAWYLYDVSFTSFLKNDAFDWPMFVEVAIVVLSLLLFPLQLWQGFAFYRLGAPRTESTNAEVAKHMEIASASPSINMSTVTHTSAP